MNKHLDSGNHRSGMLSAIRKYFDLMYEVDLEKFNEVFHPQSHLYGLRGGVLSVWPAQEYREILKGRQSPRALGAKREEEIILIDFISDSLAVAKVRVRIGQNVFIDYLTYSFVDGAWLVISKAYHIVP